MADERYNRLDNSSPAQNRLDSSKPDVPRSAFPWSHIVSGQALFGALTPVFSCETVPNMELDINLNAFLEFRNPSIRQLLNGCTVFFHAFYNRESDLWEGSLNYHDRGRSGNIALEKPGLIYKSGGGDFTDCVVNANTPLSLMNYLDVPSQKFVIALTDGENVKHTVGSLYAFKPAISTAAEPSLTDVDIVDLSPAPDYISAIDFMAYQRNWRDNFANKNLLQNNKAWFPDNEEHFILSYNCKNACAINYENEDFSKDDEPDNSRFLNISGLGSDNDFSYDAFDTYYNKITPECNNPSTSVPNESLGSYYYPNLAGLKFRQARGDRFTTALPFPDLIRGNIPALDIVLNTDDIGIKYDDDGVTKNNSTYLQYDVDSDGSAPYSSERYLSLYFKGESPDSNFGDISQLKFKSVITQNDLRALETFTVFKERLARTKGDYNDMIETMFGFNPRVHDRTATYIGGCSQKIIFNSVTQTSESDTSPLGTKSGLAISSSGGRIGHFRCPDYGVVQIYMSIVPDTYYTQGLPKRLSKHLPDEEYIPLFNNLAPQPILNKELYISGDPSVDNMPFAYEDRYEEFRSMPNRVKGLSALPHNVAEFDSSRVMARRFSSTPALNSQFVTLVPENIDMDAFYFNNEPPFDFSIGFDMTMVGPFPYTSIPGSQNIHA